METKTKTEIISKYIEACNELQRTVYTTQWFISEETRRALLDDQINVLFSNAVKFYDLYPSEDNAGYYEGVKLIKDITDACDTIGKCTYRFQNPSPDRDSIQRLLLDVVKSKRDIEFKILGSLV